MSIITKGSVYSQETGLPFCISSCQTL